MNDKKHPSIEIEFRARFDKKEYLRLEKFFQKNAEDLGEDDKNVFFFIFPDKLFKIVDEISKNKAKLVLKLNKIGCGSDFKEIEIPIERKEVKKAIKLFKNLGLGADLMESFQERHNYLYQGVEAALKYSDHWGYHLELEILINNLSQKEATEEKIKKVAEELDVHLMTNEELKEFTCRAEEKYKRKSSSK